jgi:hypothetical protein
MLEKMSERNREKIHDKYHFIFIEADEEEEEKEYL